MKPVDEDKPFEFMNSYSSDPFDEAAPREFDIVKIALRYKWLLVIGLLSGLAVGQVAFLKLGPEYNAIVQILVSRRAQVPDRDGTAQAWSERAEHLSIIRSAMLVEKAIETGKLLKLPTLQNSNDPVDDILDCLEAKRTAGQDSSFLNVFELKFRNKQRADAHAVMNAIIVAYRDYLKESQEEITSELLTQVSKMNDELSQQISEKQEELFAYRKEAPLQWRTAPGDRRQPGDVTNVHQERIVEIQKERTLNLLRRAEINGKIKAMQNAIDAGRSHEDLENLVRLLVATTQIAAGQNAAVLAVPQTEQANTQLLPLLLEEQKLLRDYSDDHPDVQNVRKSIARVKQFYEIRGVLLPELTGVGTPVTKTNLIGGYMHFLKQQLEELEIKDAELTGLYETESEKVKDVVKYLIEDQARSEELERLKVQWNAIAGNVSQLDMTRDNKGYSLKLLGPVREEWSLKRYLKIVGAATILMLGLCASLVFLREWRDTTVKSADEIRKLMQGVPVLGSVPRFDATQIQLDPNAALHPSLCYFHRPGSAEAESYRTVRTALVVGLDPDKHKVIQVSSPEPGDGKSTFISNLAIALAQSGKKVLLLDADLRRPTMHHLFDARQETGTAEVLAGEIQLGNALQQSPIANLWLLSAGKSPPNPAETLASPRLEYLFATARSGFDFVLVDTPPLLVVSDPCIVASRTDGLLLVVRTNKTSHVALRQASRLIRQHDIRLLGTVANAVESLTAGKNRYSGGYTDYLKPNQPALRPSLAPETPRGVPA